MFKELLSFILPSKVVVNPYISIDDIVYVNIEQILKNLSKNNPYKYSMFYDSFYAKYLLNYKQEDLTFKVKEIITETTYGTKDIFQEVLLEPASESSIYYSQLIMLLDYLDIIDEDESEDYDIYSEPIIIDNSYLVVTDDYFFS